MQHQPLRHLLKHSLVPWQPPCVGFCRTLPALLGLDAICPYMLQPWYRGIRDRRTWWRMAWLGLAKSQIRSPLSKHAGAQSCIMISDCSWNPLTTGTGIISIHKKMSTRSEQLPHISYHVSWLPSLTIIPFLISSLPKHINMIHVISSFIDSFVIPCLILTLLPLPDLTYCINAN